MGSIIFVGIGNRSNFEDMKFLDDFAGRDERDICQFVEFEAHENDKTSLAKMVFEEVPDQLVDHFYKQGIMPLRAQVDNKFDGKIKESDFIHVNHEKEYSFKKNGKMDLISF